jgi:hypothetical protein
MNGELGMQNLLCAPGPRPLTAVLLQFTIQNCPSPQPLAPLLQLTRCGGTTLLPMTCEYVSSQGGVKPASPPA